MILVKGRVSHPLNRIKGASKRPDPEPGFEERILANGPDLFPFWLTFLPVDESVKRHMIVYMHMVRIYES